MLKKILIALALIVLVLVVVIAMQPADFRITRSAAISAPPAVIFAQVNELRKWEAWSPWAKLDPNAKNTYEGPAAGVGSAMAWAGNNKVGEGRMTITESHPSEQVVFRLEFIKPMKATNTSEFTFKPEGNQTIVSWTMSGQNNFFGKAFGLFMKIDKMVGADFEKGLASLKSEAEAAGKN